MEMRMQIAAATVPCSLELEILPDGSTEIEIRQGSR